MMWYMSRFVCNCAFVCERWCVWLVKCSLSELTNQVNELISRSISRRTCFLVDELSVNSINSVLCVHLGDFNRNLVCLYLGDLNQKFQVHLVWTQIIENVLTPSSFLPLKYDLPLEPNNRVSRRTQWLVGKGLEAVNHSPIKNKEIRNR